MRRLRHARQERPRQDIPRGTVNRAHSNTFYAHLADIHTGWKHAGLSINERQALLLRYGLDLTQAQTAHILRRPRSTVRNHIYTGVGRIVACINRQPIDTQTPAAWTTQIVTGHPARCAGRPVRPTSPLGCPNKAPAVARLGLLGRRWDLEEAQAVADARGCRSASYEAEQATEENADHRVSLRANLVAECEEQAANNAEDYEDDKPTYGLEETHESVSTFRWLELVNELWELVHKAVTGDLFDVLGV